MPKGTVYNTGTVLYSLMSISQGHSELSVCARRGLGAVFLFQMMLHDQWRSAATVHRGGAGQALSPPGRSAGKARETLSHAPVGLGTFLFCCLWLVLFRFRFGFFVWFGFFNLICQ